MIYIKITSTKNELFKMILKTSNILQIVIICKISSDLHDVLIEEYVMRQVL